MTQPTLAVSVTKKRLSGNVTIRADLKNQDEQLGSGSWINVSLRGLDMSADLAREKAAQYTAIADELDRLRANGEEADW
ncbi:hypothetical protein [Rhodococcoides fascians]|uniref:hypothetical protein n=1 Tax=Rhodococcoides fascians TaxID=1828 RepID=UPI00056B5C65|nr:hypothetical protein [Rhodococcus fascians]